jgi:hypothetical protein
LPFSVTILFDRTSPVPSEPLHPARDVNPALAPARRPPLKLVEAAGIVDAGVEVEGVVAACGVGVLSLEQPATNSVTETAAAVIKSFI